MALSPRQPVGHVDQKSQRERQKQNRQKRNPVNSNAVACVGAGHFEKSHGFMIGGMGMVFEAPTAQSRDVERLSIVAAALSPGMAKVLEKVVAGHLTRVRPKLSIDEAMLLQCAAAALSVVNRTPHSAAEIGRAAAVAVSRNPDAMQLIEAVATVNQRRIA